MQTRLLSSDELEAAFTSIAACPVCNARLSRIVASAKYLVCSSCGRVFSREDGIWRFLLPEQQIQYQPFLESYPILRCGDGWERQDDAYYLNLPDVPVDDPQAFIWKIRRWSFQIVKTHCKHRYSGWVADLGAGNCWLSHRLALEGHRVLALDLQAENRDGLSGGSVYLEQRDASFIRVQASMERLPIVAERMVMCIISGAFHYVNADITLRRAYNVLEPGGQLLITDSPVYRNSISGAQMMSEQFTRFHTQYGLTHIPVEGKGYLVFDEVMSALHRAGFKVSIRWPELPGSRLFQKLSRRTLGYREKARFPVFIASKPNPSGSEVRRMT